jgi:hypothetical protein
VMGAEYIDFFMPVNLSPLISFKNFPNGFRGDVRWIWAGDRACIGVGAGSWRAVVGWVWGFVGFCALGFRLGV